MEQRKTVTFRVCGDGMTETAREFLYRNHKYETALELLKGCLVSEDLSEEQQLSLCLDILEGRARLTGIYPDGDYHLEKEEKDLPGIGGLICSLSEQLKAEQERRQKLELHRNFLISCLTEEMPVTCRDYLTKYRDEFEDSMLTREEETSLGIVWPVRTGLHGMVDSFLDRMSCDLDEEDYGWLAPDGTSGTYLRDQEIPAQAYFGLVEPEPENAYDPDAVRVSIGLADGTYAPIGHLPQTEPDRKSIKAPKKVLVFILDYTVIQPSYHKGYRVFGLTTDPDLLEMTGLAFLHHLNHPYPRSRKGDLVERFPGHDIVELI